jgi:hypothetical protein
VANGIKQVAMKRFIDDIAIQVVEFKLIAALGEIFSPVKVFCMDSGLVTLIAGESEENRTTRQELTKKLGILQAGRDTCKRFINVRLVGKKAVGDFVASAYGYHRFGLLQVETELRCQ